MEQPLVQLISDKFRNSPNCYSNKFHEVGLKLENIGFIFTLAMLELFNSQEDDFTIESIKDIFVLPRERLEIHLSNLEKTELIEVITNPHRHFKITDKGKIVWKIIVKEVIPDILRHIEFFD